MALSDSLTTCRSRTVLLSQPRARDYFPDRQTRRCKEHTSIATIVKPVHTPRPPEEEAHEKENLKKKRKSKNKEDTLNLEIDQREQKTMSKGELLVTSKKRMQLEADSLKRDRYQRTNDYASADTSHTNEL